MTLSRSTCLKPLRTCLSIDRLSQPTSFKLLHSEALHRKSSHRAAAPTMNAAPCSDPMYLLPAQALAPRSLPRQRPGARSRRCALSACHSGSPVSGLRLIDACRPLCPLDKLSRVDQSPTVVNFACSCGRHVCWRVVLRETTSRCPLLPSATLVCSVSLPYRPLHRLAVRSPKKRLADCSCVRTALPVSHPAAPVRCFAQRGGAICRLRGREVPQLRAP